VTIGEGADELKLQPEVEDNSRTINVSHILCGWTMCGIIGTRVITRVIVIRASSIVGVSVGVVVGVGDIADIVERRLDVRMLRIKGHIEYVER